jgi:hypothetical protein
MPPRHDGKPPNSGDLAHTPFSEAMDASSVGGSAPDLANHPHLDSSMRSLSSSVAARRKVCVQINWTVSSWSGSNGQSGIAI